MNPKKGTGEGPTAKGGELPMPRVGRRQDLGSPQYCNIIVIISSTSSDY